MVRGGRLSGTLPDSLPSLTALAYLDLGENALSGNLPSGLSGLSQLAHLGGSGRCCYVTIDNAE